MDGRERNGWNRKDIFLTILLVLDTLAQKCQLNDPSVGLLEDSHCKFNISKLIYEFCILDYNLHVNFFKNILISSIFYCFNKIDSIGAFILLDILIGQFCKGLINIFYSS